MSVEHLAASTPVEQIAATLGRDGVVVVDRVVPPDVMDRAGTELEPYLHATAVGTDEFSGRRTRRTGGLVARSATSRELIMHPLVLDTVRVVLGDVASFQLHLTQVIAIGPGEPPQLIHRD